MNKLFYLLGIIILLYSCNDNGSIKTGYNSVAEMPARSNFSEKDLLYKGQSVKLTKHGSCRMECRKLDAYEVQEVINVGRIIKRKSNPNSKPCPTIAYEGKTIDGQLARVVVGACEGDIKIVTVIDLKKEWDCNCR
jgi:hypothetical protein